MRPPARSAPRTCPRSKFAIQDRMFDTNGQLYFRPAPWARQMHKSEWCIPSGFREFGADIITVNGKTCRTCSVAPRKYRFRS